PAAAAARSARPAQPAPDECASGLAPELGQPSGAPGAAAESEFAGRPHRSGSGHRAGLWHQPGCGGPPGGPRAGCWHWLPAQPAGRSILLGGAGTHPLKRGIGLEIVTQYAGGVADDAGDAAQRLQRRSHPLAVAELLKQPQGLQGAGLGPQGIVGEHGHTALHEQGVGLAPPKAAAPGNG
nr:hypothetical protein [Tanacetum cinerariifolium]